MAGPGLPPPALRLPSHGSSGRVLLDSSVHTSGSRACHTGAARARRHPGKGPCILGKTKQQVGGARLHGLSQVEAAPGLAAFEPLQSWE